VNAKDVRALALSLPEVREEPHFDRASFRVRGKIFATIAPDGESGMLKLDLDAHESLLAAEPGTFFSFGGFSRNGATGVRFARVKKQVFRELLGEAWRNVAPKTLVGATPKEPGGRSGTKR
jgi:hypothetical protein